MTTVLIADDHPIFRHGLKTVLDQIEWLDIVGEAVNGHEVIELLQELTPDLLLLDLSMPELNGFQVLDRITPDPKFKIIIMTSFNDRAYLDKAIDLGAHGFILKDNDLTELIKCIEQVLQNKNYVSPSVESKSSHQELLINNILKDLSVLTKTELKVMFYLGDFLTSKEIARKMNISYRTVQNHRSNIKQKLELSGMHQLTKIAQKYKSKIKSIMVS